MEKESGIVRQWEDEQLDVRMRDLRVTEGGLITENKVNEFNKEFQ